jgi:hypothetical protein
MIFLFVQSNRSFWERPYLLHPVIRARFLDNLKFVLPAHAFGWLPMIGNTNPVGKSCLCNLWLENKGLQVNNWFTLIELWKKYLVTPFFVDQLSFNLTSFRHYPAFIRSEKMYKIAVSIHCKCPELLKCSPLGTNIDNMRITVLQGHLRDRKSAQKLIAKFQCLQSGLKASLHGPWSHTSVFTLWTLALSHSMIVIGLPCKL